MKKFIVALTLVCVTLFAGCSCNSPNYLEFSKPWTGAGKNETAVYDIDFRTDFTSGDDFDFTTDKELKDNFNMVIDEGVYQTVYKEVPQASAKIDGEVIDLSVLKEYKLDTSEGGTSEALIYYKTEAKIKGKYVAGEERSFDDLIITESYFLKSELSLAPIYSRKLVKTTAVAIQKTNPINATYSDTATVSVTKYLDGKYVLDTFNGENATKYISSYLEDKLDHTTLQPDGSTKYKYTFRTVLDNSSTLFATRCLNLELEGTATIPIVDYTYGKSKKLKFENYAKTSSVITVNYNGVDEGEVSVPTNCYSFKLNNKNAGRAKLAFVQSSGVEDKGIADTSMLVKYVEPLTEYGSFKCLGALEFNLKEITLN